MPDAVVICSIGALLERKEERIALQKKFHQVQVQEATRMIHIVFLYKMEDTVRRPILSS